MSDHEVSGSEDCDSKAPSPPPESAESPQPKRPVAKVQEKIGEDRDNLRQRGEWFRRRSGGG